MKTLPVGLTLTAQGSYEVRKNSKILKPDKLKDIILIPSMH